MDTDRILGKTRDEEQERKEVLGIGENTVSCIVRVSPQLRSEAIIIARRNGTTLSHYLRRCIQELVEQHQDNDQPRIEAWTAGSPIKAWPIPQLDIRAVRFKGWTRKEVQEYEDALRNTLRSLEQARLAMKMHRKDYYDPAVED